MSRSLREQGRRAGCRHRHRARRAAPAVCVTNAGRARARARAPYNAPFNVLQADSPMAIAVGLGFDQRKIHFR